MYLGRAQDEAFDKSTAQWYIGYSFGAVAQLWESACMACRRSRVQSSSAPPFIFAKVAELVYALVSKTSSFTAVRVLLPPLALFIF